MCYVCVVINMCLFAACREPKVSELVRQRVLPPQVPSRYVYQCIMLYSIRTVYYYAIATEELKASLLSYSTFFLHIQQHLLNLKGMSTYPWPLLLSSERHLCTSSTLLGWADCSSLTAPLKGLQCFPSCPRASTTFTHI